MLDKTFQPADVETRRYLLWESMHAFAADPNSEALPYTIMMPPPNITGSLHMGHALTFTLQDVLIRHHRMLGHDVLWQPGTDHAGIATQMVVERQLAAHGLSRHDVGRDAFFTRMWEWKAHSGGTIMTQLRRLGSSPDWARERFTMDKGLSHAVRQTFVNLYKQGLIYRDKRLVNWDPQLHTAVSDLEVQQREIVGTLWHFRYPLEGGGKFLTVATTRPETLLGDTAVAVHPEDARYRSLIGQRCLLPIAERLIPIIADSCANPEKGSGAVKITPAHDFNDFEVARRHGLPMINILNYNACMNENTPLSYRGLDRDAAREKVVACLTELGLLEKVEANPMVLPYGDRSGAVIEPWLTDQWFLDVRMLAEPAIRAVQEGRTCFFPKHWEETYYDWMRNIQPWCISRQIWWGHLIPAWYGPDGSVFVETTAQEAVEAAAVHYGTPVQLKQEGDVLDTWFSSALWPFASLGWPERTRELARYYPTDVLVTGFDIIFFWVARMMMLGLHVMGDVPFKTVYIHALVRDEKGQKMSKSKGNIINPLSLIDKYGCDALRFTLAASAVPGRDIRMSEQRVHGYRNFATKLWNAARFCVLHRCSIMPSFEPASVHGTLNRWIVGKVNETGRKVTDALATYRFNDATHAIYIFTWNTFCDWYLEFAKPLLLYAGSDALAETRATAAWVLEKILILLHPFMPFITEELWEKKRNGEGPRVAPLIATPWPTCLDISDTDAAVEMDFVVEVIAQIRSIRSEMNVPQTARVPLIFSGGSTKSKIQLKKHKNQIATLTRAGHVEILDQADCKGAVQGVVGETTILLQLADTIDPVQEKIRLAKEIQRLGAEIGRIDQKLNNAAFVEKAPAHVVDDTRVRRTRIVTTRQKLETALQRFATL